MRLTSEGEKNSTKRLPTLSLVTDKPHTRKVWRERLEHSIVKLDEILNQVNDQFEKCSRGRLTYIQKAMLNISQRMTIGAKMPEILVIPRGWSANRKTKMPQDAPMMVPVEIFGWATLSPWIAPSTDCAGVKIPSAMIKLTPKTATSFIRRWTALLFSRNARMPSVVERRSFVLCRLLSTGLVAFGSNWDMLHCHFD